jgi:predicted nucleotidyltransferase
LNKLSDDIAYVRDRIVETYQPDKIVLFGSAATASARADSDLDLLVIKRTTAPYFDRVLEVRRALHLSRPVDVLVLTPEEYEKALADNRYLLTKEILPKGKVIYERPGTLRRRSGVA